MTEFGIVTFVNEGHDENAEPPIDGTESLILTEISDVHSLNNFFGNLKTWERYVLYQFHP